MAPIRTGIMRCANAALPALVAKARRMNAAASMNTHPGIPPLPHHHQSEGLIPATVEDVFALLDDHSRLSAHMSKRSWKLGGGRMMAQFDADAGRAVGSRIRLGGRVFGLQLELEEVVTERTPPVHKAWQTVGTPRLLVIAQYRMGFRLSPQGEQCLLRVTIDYALPTGVSTRWLGRWLGPTYARWCTQRMVDDALQHFAMPRGGPRG